VAEEKILAEDSNKTNVNKMSKKVNNTGNKMRIIHRYLGFFLAGIMAMYSISGIVLIFRETDFLKREIFIQKTLEPNLKAEQIGEELKVRGLKVTSKEGSMVYFKDGSYNSETGESKITKKELPFIMDKMTHIHKATTNDPLFFLNIFFGTSLLFFVISSFWMFRPKTEVFKKGLYYTLGGIILTLILLFV
jgi:hypothetical protein